jgi:hypothetical protein
MVAAIFVIDAAMTRMVVPFERRPNREFGRANAVR